MSVKHFLHISDYSKEELWDILDLAKIVNQSFAREKIIKFSTINH